MFERKTRSYRQAFVLMALLAIGTPMFDSYVLWQNQKKQLAGQSELLASALLGGSSLDQAKGSFERLAQTAAHKLGVGFLCLQQAGQTQAWPEDGAPCAAVSSFSKRAGAGQAEEGFLRKLAGQYVFETSSSLPEEAFATVADAPARLVVGYLATDFLHALLIRQLVLFGSLALPFAVLASLLLYWRQRMERALVRFRSDVDGVISGKITRVSLQAQDPAAWQSLAASINHILHRLFAAQKEVIENKASAALAKMVQMVVHDIRRPFSFLKMFVAAMDGQNQEFFAKRKDQYLLHLKAAADKVDAMLRDILELRACTKMERAEVPLGQIIHSAITENVSAQTKEASLSFQLEHRSLAFVNAHKVTRVVSNILCNALEAMPAGGEVWITSKNLAGIDKIQVCIGNSLSYIEEADCEAIFEAFYSQHKQAGSGLGLAISKKIISDHGGEITCRSEQGRGTEFFFTLPASSQEDRVTAGLKLPASMAAAACQVRLERQAKSSEGLDLKALKNAANQKIFIIDDDREYLEVLRYRLLSLLGPSSGVEVFIYTNTMTAMQALHEAVNVALTIVDVDMGRDQINGFDCARLLRNKGCKAPIFISSHQLDPENIEKSMLAGADAYRDKPLNVAEILEIVQRPY